MNIGRNRRVLLVEDDPMTRGLLAEVLESAGFVVVSVSTASDARRAAIATDPDAAVLDVDLGPGANGFDVGDALLEIDSTIALLFLTHLPDARFAGRDPKSLPEQSSYVRKDRLSQPGLLAEALDAVLQGSSERILRDDQDPARPLSSLTRTQIQVLRMIAQGMSNQQIAEARNTSVQAVVRTISRAMQAIGATSDIEGNARVTAARNYMETAGIPSVE